MGVANTKSRNELNAVNRFFDEDDAALTMLVQRHFLPCCRIQVELKGEIGRDCWDEIGSVKATFLVSNL